MNLNQGISNNNIFRNSRIERNRASDCPLEDEIPIQSPCDSNSTIESASNTNNRARADSGTERINVIFQIF